MDNSFGIEWGTSPTPPEESALPRKRSASALNDDLPYDFEYECMQAMKQEPLVSSTPPSESIVALDFKAPSGDANVPKTALVYDYEFEVRMAMKSEPIGDVHFYARNWICPGVVGAPEVELESLERPLFLYTQLASNVPGTGCYMAHRRHPFVALVHLLKNAAIGSDVYISMPYMTDHNALDELCHFGASTERGGRNLQINMILGETQNNKNYINNCFIRNRRDVLDACERNLNIRSSPVAEGFCHSKDVVSTAGAMTGSYNFTFQARTFNQESSILLAADDPNCAQMRALLEARFERCHPVVYRREPRNQEAAVRSE